MGLGEVFGGEELDNALAELLRELVLFGVLVLRDESVDCLGE